MSQLLNEQETGINRISVAGFKSLIHEHSIELRPLTILAGTNSSGKSSMMQPLLLMKQTLASSYDPGALLLNGAHLRFTSVDQLLSRQGKRQLRDSFSIALGIGSMDLKVNYQARKKPGFQVDSMEVTQKMVSSGQLKSIISDRMTRDDIVNLFHDDVAEPDIASWDVSRDFCFLEVLGFRKKGVPFAFSPTFVVREINRLIHLPGLRGNPERTYTTTAVDELHKICRGTFETYTASILNDWQESSDTEKLLILGEQMKLLGLADKVKTKQINDTEVEVFVSRTMNGNSEDDWVSIADVGLGVSQTLPVAVALLFAEPGQLVYIEQPEIHLHPRAQYDLSKLLAHAAARGVKVVIETHSSLLLRGIQTLVATEELDHDLIALHWFTRNEKGETVINSAEMDRIGAFGDWPEDFAEVELAAEMRYLDAVENKEMETGEEKQQSDGH